MRGDDRSGIAAAVESTDRRLILELEIVLRTPEHSRLPVLAEVDKTDRNCPPGTSAGILMFDVEAPTCGHRNSLAAF
jgi:hypothetical protein